MTTFREYVLTVKPRLPRPSWTDKYWMACAGVVPLTIVGAVCSFPSSDSSFRTNYWFMLFWLGIIPLALYMNYCSKKDEGELN